MPVNVRHDGGTRGRSAAEVLSDQGSRRQVPVPGNFMDTYEKVSRAYSESAAGKPDDPRKGREFKRASGLDRAINMFGDIGEEIQSWSGQEEAAKTESKLDDIGSFLLGLGTGTISAPFTGISQLGEALTGHRATEMTDDGWIPEEDLDLGQRLATGASGAINAIGPFFGGTGAMLKTGKNALQMGAGKAIAKSGHKQGIDMMASAAKSMAKSNEAKSFGWNLAQDMAEEGAEEFIQSPLDEIRAGTMDEGWLGRAVESAGMGALGGGIMSGASYGVNKLMSRYAPKSDEESRTQPVQPSPNADATVKGFDMSRGGTIVKDARDSMTEELRDRQKAPGSANVVQATTGQTHGLNGGNIGSGVIKSIFYAPDYGRSAQKVAEWFETTVEDLKKDMDAPDYTARLDARLQALRSDGRANSLHLGRNPATEKAGRFDVDIDRIVEGDFIDLSPTAYNFVKADADGDKIAIFMDKNMRTEGYVTRRLFSPVLSSWNDEAGRYDWVPTAEYGNFTFIPKSMREDQMAAEIQRALDANGVGSLDAAGIARSIRAAARSGVNKKGEPDAEMARAFADVMRQVNDGVKSKALPDVTSADKVVSDIVAAIADNPQAEMLRYVDYALYHVNAMIDDIGDDVLDMPALSAKASSGDTSYRSRGAIANNISSIAQIFMRLNLIQEKLSDSESNPLFRQDGLLVMRGQSERMSKTVDRLEEIMRTMPGDVRSDVYDQVFAIIIKRAGIGSDVINSVSGLFNSMVMSQMTAKLKFDRASNGQEVEAMMSEFVAEYNDLVKAYNAALRKATTQGPAIDPASIEKPMLDEGDVMSIGNVRAFIEMAENYKISRFLDISDAPALENRTFGDWLDGYLSSGRTDRTQFGGYDGQFQDFINKAIDSRLARVAGAEFTVRTIMGETSNILSDVYSGGLDDSDRFTAEYALTSIRKLLDPKVANKVRLVSVDNLDTGDWGRELLSGDADRATNALLSMALTGKYMDAVDYILLAREAYAGGNMGRAENLRLMAESELGRIVGLSRTDLLIVNEMWDACKDLESLSKTGPLSRTYDALTRLDISFAEKNGAVRTNDGTSGLFILADALTTDANSVGSSGLSSKTGMAKSSLAQAQRSRRADLISTWDGMYKQYAQSDNVSEFVEAVLDLLADANYWNSIDTIAGSVYATTTLANAYKEKGLTPAQSQLLFQMAEINTNGSVMSFSDKYFGYATGNVSIETLTSNPSMILRAILDRDFSVRVYDKSTDSDGEWSRSKLFDDLGIDGDELNLNALDKIFRTFPQILTYLPDASLSPSVSQSSGSPVITDKSNGGVAEAVNRRMLENSNIARTSGGIDSEGNPAAARRNRKIVEAHMLNDTGYTSALILRLGDIDDDLSLDGIMKKVRSTHDRMLAAFVDLASKTGDRDQLAALQAELNNIKTNQANVLREQLENAFRMSMSVLMDTAFGDNVRTATYANIHNMAAKAGVLNSVIKRINAAGLSEVERDSLMSALADTVLQVPNTTLSPSEFERAVRDSYEMSKELMMLLADGLPSSVRSGIDIDLILSEDDKVSICDCIIGSLDITDGDGNRVQPSDSMTRLVNDMFDEIGTNGQLEDTDEISMARGVLPDSGIITSRDFTDLDLKKNDKGRTVIDVNGPKFNALIEKILKINSENNFDNADPDEVRKDTAKLCQRLLGGVPEARSELDKTLTLWNSMKIKQRILDMSRKTGVDNVNSGLVNTYVTDIETICRIAGECRDALFDEHGSANLPSTPSEGSEITPMPIADYADGLKGFMANRALVNSTRGPAAITVGVNGTANRDNEALTLLPRNVRTKIPPRRMGYADILREVKSDNDITSNEGSVFKCGWNRFIGANVYEGPDDFTPADPDDKNSQNFKMRPLTARDLYELRSNPGKTILVFDPNDSPNGIDFEHRYMPNSGNRMRSLRVLQGLGVLGDASQEGMALKLSKTTNNNTKLTSRVDQEETVTRFESVNPSSYATPADLAAAMRDEMNGFRNAVRKHLVNVFKMPRHKVAGMSPQNAYEFAQLLTPYFTVQCENGEAVVNVGDVFAADPAIAGESLSKRLAEIEAEHGHVLAISPALVTPEKLASHIAEAEMRLASRSGSVQTSEEAANAAYKALIDWRSYKSGGLSTKDILYRVRPRGDANIPYVIGDDSEAMLNKFLAKIYGDEESGRRLSRKWSPSNGLDSAGQNVRAKIEDANRRIESHTDSGAHILFAEFGHGKRKIVKSFYGSGIFDKSNKSKFSEMRRLFDPLRSTPDDVNNGDETTLGIALDVEGMREAVAWGCAYRQPFLLPLSIAENSDNRNLLLRYGHVDYENEIEIHNEKFVIAYPYGNETFRYAIDNRVVASVSDIDTDEIVSKIYDPAIALADSGGLSSDDENTLSLGTDMVVGDSISAKSLFKNLVGHPEIVTADEIRNLSEDKRALDEMMGSLRILKQQDFKDMTDREIRSAVLDFVSTAANAGTDHLTHVTRGDVIALVKAENPNGKTMYAPVVIANNKPKAITGASVSVMDDGSIEWFGDATHRLAPNEVYKTTAASTSFKAMVVPTDQKNMPKLAFTVGGEEQRANFVYNYETYSGRTDSFDSIIMLNNLWYGYIKYGGSAFFDYDPSTKKCTKKAIFKNMPEAMFENLVNGRISAWEQIWNGAYRIHEDDRINDLFITISKNCYWNSIPMNYMFSSVTADGALRGKDMRFELVLSGMSRSDMLRFFHALNENLCPGMDGDSFPPHKYDNTIFDQYGNIWVKLGDRTVNLACELAPSRSLGKGTDIERLGNSAMDSMQRTQRGGMESPLSDRDAMNIIEDLSITNEDLATYNVIAESRRAERISEHGDRLEEFAPLSELSVSDYLSESDIPGYSPFTTYKEIMHQQSVADVAKTFRVNPPIYGYDGTEIEGLKSGTSNPASGSDHSVERREIVSAMQSVQRALGTNQTLDWQHFVWLMMYDGGTTLNGGAGTFKLSVEDIKESARRIVRNIEEKGLPVAVDEKRMITVNDRFSVPMLAPDMAAYFYRFDNIRSRFENMDRFIGAMDDESRAAIGLINNLVQNKNRAAAIKKRDALLKFVDWTFREHGRQSPTMHVYENQYAYDLIANSSKFWSAVLPGVVNEAERNALIEESKRTELHMADLNSIRMDKVSRVSHGDGEYVNPEYDDVKMIDKILDFLVRSSQTMGVLSLPVSLSNIATKGINTNMTFAALAIGRNTGVGAYGTDIMLNQDAVRNFAKNPLVHKAFAAYRMAMIDGDVHGLISAVENEAQLDAYIEKQNKRGGVFKKISDQIFNASNGFGIFTDRQLQNFANYFFLLERDAGHNFWFAQSDETGLNMAETMLGGNNPQRFFIEVMLGRNDNASFGNAQVAMNFAMQGDMAQRNIVTMLYQEAVRRYGSGVKFLTSTMVSRFFCYRTNAMGRTLQWVLPMSSINYVVTDYVSKWAQEHRGEGGLADAVARIHVEDAQVYTSLKRAMKNDVVHLAPHLIALVLALIPGLIEPPEDEKKKGNPQEWLFAGQRVYMDWELEDIMGLTLPLACSYKSMLDGDPRIDILGYGISQAMYNNPIARMSDVVALFGDGDGSIMTSYEQDVETFADAKGGSPSFNEWLRGKFSAAGLSFLGQFITPSFIRDMIDSDMEHSYKRIYEEGPTGELTEEGMSGRTMKTDYFDAQVRKVTRNNPVLAWLCDFAVRPNTSYTEEGMPLVEYYDPIALESMEHWSINGPDGEPLPYDQQEAKIVEIIGVLQSTDDMEALWESGFYLDYDTRDAVGDTIWDICAKLQDDYNDLKASGGLSWEVLGEGDPYGLGKQREAEITSAFYDDLNYWKSIYYDKLQSEPLRRSVPVYNRYKTSYATDSDGNVYATGYMTHTGLMQSLSPVKTAPGSMSDPGGTLGYEGDWETPSVINGESTGERALIPTEQGYYDYVDFEAHAANGDGTGYSKRWVGDHDDDDDGDSDTSTYGGESGFRNYGRSYGRRGGGGGGGYSPNLYSRLPNFYPPSARTMYAERTYKTDYDYLRPNFETKGSREAYKRSDI